MAEITNTIKTVVEIDATQATQEVIKLNAAASDTTKSLDERIKSKNEAVKIGSDLTKKNIANLEKELAALNKNNASSKEIEKVQKRLNAAKIKQTRESANNEKALNKLNEAQKKSSSSTENLDKATGGLISKFKLLATNPIFLVMGLLSAIFTTVTKAINSTEDGSAKLNAILAGLSQIFTNLITILSDALMPILDVVIEAFSKYLSPALESIGVFSEAAKLAFAGLVDYFKLALTPIKAVIAGIKALVAYKEGGLGAAKKVMSEFGKEVKDTAISMKDNFVGAVKETVKAIKELPAAFYEATKSGDNLLNKAVDIELWQNRFNKAKREQRLLDAQLNTQSKEGLAVSKDLSKSWDEREAGLNSYFELEKQRNSAAAKILNEEIALQEAKMSLGGNQIEDEETLNNLLIRREQLNADLANSSRQFYRRQTEFINKRIAEEKKLQAEKIRIEQEDAARLEAITIANQEYADREFEVQLERDALDIERRRLQGENVVALELELLNKQKEQELSNTELTYTEQLAIIEKYEAKALALKEVAVEAKGKLDMQSVGYAQTALMALWGDNKIVASAVAGIDMLKGIMAGVSLGFPAMIPAIAAAGAVGYSTIKKINSAKKPTGTSSVPRSGSSSGSGGGSTTAPPAIPQIQDPTKLITDITESNASRIDANNIAKNADITANLNKPANVLFSEDAYSTFKTQVQFKEDRSQF